MGKAGRIACIFTPMALTIASLICIILVGLGGTKKGNSTLEDFYFFKANLRNFTADPSLDLIPGTDIDNKYLTDGLLQAKKDLNLKDYYTVALWNYCSGDWKDGKIDYTFCSEKKRYFWFNPVEVWKLNDTGVENLFPKELTNGLKLYKKVAHWMFVTYAIAFFLTLTEVVVGFTAIFSRWGSFATTIIASIATFFTIAYAIIATALYATLAGSFNHVLKPYGIRGTLGHSMYVTIWIGVAFSLAAGLFWLFSVCCCSGRSPYNHKDRAGAGKGRVRVEKTPYTYERVGSPYLGAREGQAGQSVPMLNLPAGLGGSNHQSKTGAYEPFRHEHV